MLLAPRKHRRVRLEASRRKHLVVGEVRAGPVRRERLLGIVQGTEAVGERGQRLAHTGHVFGIVAVQVAHGGQTAIVPHERKASADVAGGEALVRGVVMRVRVAVVELVGDRGDRRQVLERGEGGVRVGQTHSRLAHGHGRVEVTGQCGVAPVLTGALQDRSHAGNHRRTSVGYQVPVGGR